jgi:DNA polymerase-3 subunit delta'
VSALDAVRRLAVEGRLYPGVILHGGRDESRRAAALELARTLLCEAEPDQRPCGRCRHCRRIVWPEVEKGSAEEGLYHPDFQVLLRDLKTSTSVEATKRFLRGAQVAPFEARGQVFVIANAESLTGEAANALLKTLEEPHTTAPRNFFLLTPSQLDLLPTLRSRCLALFLGPAEPIDPGEVEPLAEAFGAAVAAWGSSGSAAHLLAAAAALGETGGWEEPRAGRPWAVAASAVVAAVHRGGVPESLHRRLLALAEALLEAPQWRLRGIPHGRLLEGLVSRHLAG